MLLSWFSFIAQQITNGCIIPAGFCVDILEWGGLWGVYSSLGRSKHFWEVIKGDIAVNQQALMSAELKNTHAFTVRLCVCVSYPPTDSRTAPLSCRPWSTVWWPGSAWCSGWWSEGEGRWWLRRRRFCCPPSPGNKCHMINTKTINCPEGRI